MQLGKRWAPGTEPWAALSEGGRGGGSSTEPERVAREVMRPGGGGMMDQKWEFRGWPEGSIAANRSNKLSSKCKVGD